MKLVKCIGIAIGGLLPLGFIYLSATGRASRWSKSPLPSGLVSVGDHRLHIWCASRRGSTVLLLSGDGTPSVTMYAAQNRIARFTTACSYYRAGLGWSDPPRPMGLAEQVHDLKELVQRDNLATSLVLIPKSGGNLIALSFFDRSPTSVAGMVMVDGSKPELWFRGSPDEFPSMRMMSQIWHAGWHLLIVRILPPYAVPQGGRGAAAKSAGAIRCRLVKPMPGYTRDTIDRWSKRHWTTARRF